VAVVVNPCNGSNGQKWYIGPNGELHNVGSAGYCADINQATFQGDGNGAQVVLQPCDDQVSQAPVAPASQLWGGVNTVCAGSRPLSYATCIGHLHNAEGQGKCLDVPGNHFYQLIDDQGHWNFLDASRTPVQLWDCEPQDEQHGYDYNQIWYQLNNGDGSWTYFVSGNQDYCLDSQGLQSPGSPVVVWSCNGGNNQKWTLGPAGQFESVGSPGYCADINQASFQGDGNGAQVVLEPCMGLGSALYPSY
jgi:hypothetical protein